MAGALGLPRNAWINAKMYADTAFPTNTVTGDRILRTDLGYWFTFVTLSGTDYWIPDPGALLVDARQATFNSLAAGVDTQVTGMTTITKNYSTWWASNTFTPQVPGYYTCGGGVGFATATPGNYRQAFLQKNGTTDIPASGNRVVPVTSSATVVPLRATPIWFNGSTDFVRLFAATATATDTVANSAWWTTQFWAQYSGPFVA